MTSTTARSTDASLRSLTPSGLRSELAKALEAKRRRRDRNRLASYSPYTKQFEFHATGAGARERLLMAGNQLGKTYADPGGVMTVGYGHTGAEVRPGLRISLAQARAWLADDLQAAARRLDGVVKPSVLDALSEAQYSALLSFAFNLGANPRWTIWKRLNAGRLDAIPAEMMRFVHIGRTRVAGLVNRRAAEVALWSGGGEAAPPSSYSRVESTPPALAASKPLFQSRTAITGAAQVVGGVWAGALAVQQTVAPYAQQAAMLGKIVAALAVFMAACGVVLLAIKWLERREATR